MGDPVGIGPEVVLKACCASAVRDLADVVVFGDRSALEIAARRSASPCEILTVGSAREARGLRGRNIVAVVPVSSLSLGPEDYGRPRSDTDRAQLDYITRALECVLDGGAEALATGPISKASIARAGAPWPGHTEMLAELCRRGGPPLRPVMMLAGDRLRVVTLTTHVPLRSVPSLISREEVSTVLRIIHEAWGRYFGSPRPRIGVAGLNPHAGEDGLLGDEEGQVIGPAIASARDAGILAFGPFPGDTIFRRALSGELDVVLGMYHDQSLIPVKLLEFDSAVNVTLGLPIVRTSPDHGTAYDIAGKDVASPGSMISALKLAARMASNLAEGGGAL